MVLPLSGMGSFDFSINSYNEVLFIGLIGIIGIFAGLLLEHVFDKKKNISLHPILKERKNRYLFSLWILLTYAVDLLLWHFGCGQMGVDRALPYHLQGLIYYYRMITVPFVSFIFLDIAINNQSKKDVRYIFMAILLGAIICQFASLSRSAIIIRILPILIYIFFYDQQHVFGSNKAKTFLGILILFLILITTSLVTNFRDIVWETSNSRSALDSISTSIKAIPDFGQFIKSLLSLFIARALGIQELMAVYAAKVRIEYSPSLFIKLLCDSHFFTDFYNQEVLVSSSYSYLASGSPGLFGFLYFSGSIIFVLFVLLCGSFAINKIGVYFYNRGFKITGYGIATIFILLFWSGAMIQAGISIIILFLSWIFLRYIISFNSKTLKITINGRIIFRV